MEEGRIAGVSPGGIRDPYHVKILICYLLDKVADPMTEEQLIEILTGDQTVNYFLLTSTIAEMKKLGHLHKEGKGYCLSPLGRETAEKLSGELPMTLRERVLAAASETTEFHRRQEETDLKIVETEQGFRVDFSFHDQELEFMQLSLYAPDLEQAGRLREGLLTHYQELYPEILRRLLGE